MLSIQPNFSTNYKPAFKSAEYGLNPMDKGETDFGVYEDCFDCKNNEKDIENYVDLSDGKNLEKDIDIFKDEDTYTRAKAELEGQKDEFESLVKDKDLNLPKPAKKLIKGGAVITGSILGGMATGWGAKKSIAGMKALNKAKAVVGMKAKLGKAWTAVKEFAGKIWKKFTDSKVYTTPKNKLNKLGEKFANSKIGKPITKAYDSVKDFVGKGFKKVKDGLNWVLNKIKGVKKETYEKAAVNTVGVSGGIASGVTALKEQNEKVAE